MAGLKRVQANLKRYRAAVLKAACEGKLVPTEAELHKVGRGVPPSRSSEPAHSESSPHLFETGAELLERILIDRRKAHEEQQKNAPRKKKYKEPVAPDLSDLPGLPEGWTWTSIGMLFHVEVGATPSRKKLEYWSGSIPWVSSGEVRFNYIGDTREKITHEGLANSSTQVNPSGSVLLGMIGEGKTRGQTAILKIDACNNQNCAAIWVSESDVPPEFVHYWLWSQYDATRRGSSGNNQPALNKTRVEAMLIPLPPPAEQKRIVEEVERRLSVIEEMETAVAANLKRATRLRQSILKKAFEGKLV